MPALFFIIIFIFFSPLFTTPVFAKDTLKIRVGAYDNPPKIHITQDGKVVGFWPELISNIAAKEGWEIEYVKSAWGEALTNLETNKIDLMPDVAFTKARSRLYAFTNTPVIASWSRVYVRENDNSVKSLEDLKNKRIVGLSGSANLEGPDGIKKIVQSFNLKCTVREMESYKDVFQALEDGFADVVITNRNFGDEYTKTHPVKQTPIMLSPTTITFALPIDGKLTDLISRRIDFHLTNMMNDNNSFYYQLLSKYFETKIAEKTIKELPLWSKYFIGFAVISLLFLLTLTTLARFQVKQKTKDLRELNQNLQKRIDSETDKRIKNEKILFEQKKFADMGQMIGAIAHQWRQPLNNVYLISQWLQEQWEEGKAFETSHAEHFSKQYDLINHMSQTIDDFSTFFKPEVEKNQFNLANTVLTSLRLINNDLMRHKIMLDAAYSCEDEIIPLKGYATTHDCNRTLLMTSGHEGQLKQIILNLINNAKDAILSQNRDYRKISVTISPTDTHVSISIEDNGGGIPEDILPKVFDPYFTTKQEGDGIGIGLYMTKAILKNHMEGDITLENTADGVKATVTIKKVTV